MASRMKPASLRMSLWILQGDDDREKDSDIQSIADLKGKNRLPKRFFLCRLCVASRGVDG